MRGESRLHVAIIKAEALAKFVPVIPAPQQLGDLPRKKKQEPEGIEKIVEKSAHSAFVMSSGVETSRGEAIGSITGFLDFARNDGSTLEE